MEKLLIVEDVQSLREQLKWGLADEYSVLEAGDRLAALELFAAHAPKVVLLDLGLPPDLRGTTEGFRCLDAMIAQASGTKVVVLTGNQEKETAYRAVACGAYDFYQKPVDLGELRIIVRRALHLSVIEEQGRRLQQVLEMSNVGIEGIADHCSAIQELLAPLQKAARTHRIEHERQRPPGESGARSEIEHPDEVGIGMGHLTLREVRDRVEKSMVHAAVENCGWNMAKASELLGVSRPALYDLMKKHRLFKAAPRP